MIIRDIRESDLLMIQHLNDAQKDFKLSSFGKIIIDKIVLDNDKPIAYGIVKRLAEAIILINPSAPIASRAKAMRELMQWAEYGSHQDGCEQLHCFVSNEKLADSLEKHFNFIKTKDIVLVKNI